MERNQIKRAREQASMSQAELAKRLGKSRQYVHQLETGSTKTSASPERLAEIAGLIGKAATVNKMIEAAWAENN